MTDVSKKHIDGAGLSHLMSLIKNDTAIVHSGSGERTIVTDDAADLPLLTLSPVLGESVQDGTPTPSAPVPIKSVKLVRNQLVTHVSSAASEQNGVTHTWNGDGSITVKGTAGTGGSSNQKSIGSLVEGHKYLIRGCPEGGGSSTYYLGFSGVRTDEGNGGIITASSTSAYLRFAIMAGTTVDFTIWPEVFDLTLAFGAGNEPKTVAEFEALFTEDYYPYCAGETGICVQSMSKNLFDKNAASKLANWISGTYIAFPIRVEVGQTVTASYSTTLAADLGFYLNLCPTPHSNSGNNPRWLYHPTSATLRNKTVTVTATDKWVYLNLYGATQAAIDAFISNLGDELIVERGSTATAYEPYQSHTAYIDLKGHELHGLGSKYKDILTVDATGHVTLEKRTLVRTVTAVGALSVNSGGTDYASLTAAPAGKRWASANEISTDGYPPKLFCDRWTRETNKYVAATWNGLYAYSSNSLNLTQSDYNGLIGATVVDALPSKDWYTVDLGYVDLPQVTDSSTVHVAAEVQPVIGGTWWTKAGYSTGRLMQDTRESQGTLEPPYTEVEWVESDGTQYVYLDWKPPIATFGFEADFIVRNTFNTTQAAWRSDTNKNNAGFIFGTRNSSSVNDVEFGTYSSYGYFRNGTSTYSTSGLFKTDKTRQTVSYKGTSLKRGDGATVTFARSSETANKPYANMAIFCYHDGLRRAGTGNILYPSSTRIYSLKFFDGDTLKVDLVGAIRNRDGMTGLYDKVKGHFYPAKGMSYGNPVGCLGEPDTVQKALAKKDIVVYVDNRTNARMLRASVPELTGLADGQKLTVVFSSTIAASTQTTELAGWDDTGNNSYVYLKLTLAGGRETEWIPCFYSSGTRLTSHYTSATPVMLTYRENVFYASTTTSAGTSVMRAFYADPNYDSNSNDTAMYVKYYNTIKAKSAITAQSIIVGDSSGYAQAADGVAFDMSYPILWCTVDLAANGTNYANIWTLIYDRNLATCYSGFSGAANAMVYLVGTVNGSTFTVASPVVTATPPSSADGKCYIPIGRMGNQTTGANYFNFATSVNPQLFAYVDGAFRPIDELAPSGVKSITRSGTTFTATRFDGTTFTFDQQDNDTKALGSMTGTLGIDHGGTGATTAAAAWTALGGGAIGKKASLAASDIPSHASSATTYGAGSSSNYGHVKLSDSTSASTDTTGGTAATPKAVKAAYDLANGASTTAGQALSAATGALAFKVTYSVSGSDVVCAAHVYSAGSEVTSSHADSCFVWSMSLDGGATWTSLGTGKTKTVSAMSTFGGNVKCDFTPAS